MVKNQVSSTTGLCPRCIKKLSRPVAACSRCSQIKSIYDEKNWFCKVCKDIVSYSLRKQGKAQLGKVECSVCGQLRISCQLQRDICLACSYKERNGVKPCTQCGQSKVIINKAKNLCKYCYHNELAKKSLTVYVINFSTPYPYNKALFDLLVSTIDWSSVSQKINQKFRRFGRFLQQRYLPNPLTWEAIEENLPQLEATNRAIPKSIRSSLLELGHLLAVQGKLESRESYILRRNALQPLNTAPIGIQPLLQLYVSWLWEKKTTPATVRDHMEVIAAFWTWSFKFAIYSPEQVQPSFISNYLLTLYWQWKCSICQKAVDFDPHQRQPPEVCLGCSSLHCFTQASRYSHNTIRQHCSKLFVFFEWALNNRLTLINPVKHKVPALPPTIKHYPLEIIPQLCKYISAPNAEPLEAFVLYLIIFHALSVWELQHAEIPTVLSLQKNIIPLSLPDAYYIIVPRPKPSRGSRTPGRPSTHLDFPEIASSWLKPLLERVEAQRQQMLKNYHNRYLILTSKSAHRTTRASQAFIQQIIYQASLRLLGSHCDCNTLRKTAAVMFADQGGAGILRWLGWEYEQAFAYSWAQREIVYPKPFETASRFKF
ncbi:MAG: hypothetical protein KME50_21650 [Nostoc desertorum CM1-VF14]|jgi:hypothetical protein|nr:hypothetical protein [Nostoc desertorum CM1-VF14]